MKPYVALLGLALLFLTDHSNAQPVSEKASPEHKKLEMMTGRWRLEEIDADSPFGKAGAVQLQSEARFVHDGLFVEERGTSKGPDGGYSYTIVYSYDPSSQKYHSIYYNSGSSKIVMETAVFEGNTWSGEWTEEVDGKRYQCRDKTIYAADGTSYTYEWTYSEDGLSWKPRFKGIARKVGKVNR